MLAFDSVVTSPSPVPVVPDSPAVVVSLLSVVEGTHPANSG